MLKSYCLYQQTKICWVIFFLFITAGSVTGQLTISGNVYDSSKIIPVVNVIVKSSGGTQAITDSSGHYEIVTSDKDSLTFIYNNKATAKFAVKQIRNLGGFDISLHIRLTDKFQTMKEVKVYTRSYREDSIENRRYYSKIFNYEKPGVSTSIDPSTGGVGMDVDELINVFRFKRNKQLKKMQERLLEQEQENYIKYRFNKTVVKRITGLEGADLDKFMLLYKPSFEFTQNATTVQFYQYILTASYQYKKDRLIKENKTANP